MQKCQIGILRSNGSIITSSWLLNTEIDDMLDFLRECSPTKESARKLIQEVEYRYGSIQDLVLNKEDVPVFIYSVTDNDWMAVE